MTNYTVQSGDTLGKIAAKFYGDAKSFPLVVAANSIADPDILAVGQELTIPDAPGGASASGSPPAPASAAGAPPAVMPGAQAPSAAPGNRVSALTEERLAGVHPELASRGRNMIQRCSEEGIAILVTQGLRTWEEQDALYAKGRTVPPIGKEAIITNAQGGSSFHNFGLAFDIVVLDSIGKYDWNAAHPGWARAAEIGKSLGLEWGGDWKTFKDLPHFQFTGGIDLAECRQLFASGLDAIWAKVA